MNDYVDILIGIWNLLWNFRLLNVSIIIWVAIPTIVGLIFAFVKGSKN